MPPGSKKLTDMTFEEVAELQKEMLRRQAGNRGIHSGPVGKYQFMPKTIEEARAKLGLKSTDRLTPGVQDMMARERLSKRGYDDFLAGKIDGLTLQDRRSAEWASIPRPSTGKSRYPGQRAGTTTEQIQAALAEAGTEAQRRISEDGMDPYGRRWR